MADLLQGSVAYDFREAINALIRSTEDAAALAARWADICDTETSKDVTITLSSGETKTIPNLGKVIKMLTDRSGAIRASSLLVSVPDHGTAIRPNGVDVGAAHAQFADGTQRTQHAYKTAYNEYYDACYMGPGASDRFEFFEVPRFVFFNTDSGVGADGSHAITFGGPKSTDALMAKRSEATVCLATQFTLVNSDPGRTVAVKLIAGDDAGANVLIKPMAPGAHCSFLMWAFKDGDALAIMEV